MNLSELRAKLNRSNLLSNLKAPVSPEEKKERYNFFCFFSSTGAAVTSVVNFWWLNTSKDEVNAMPVPQMQAGSEINTRLSEFTRKYDLFMRYRNESRQLVELAETVGRYPVALLSKPVAQEFSVPDFAPQIQIKALVVMGNGGVATLDIENETPGMLVRPGTVFGGGKVNNSNKTIVSGLVQTKNSVQIYDQIFMTSLSLCQGGCIMTVCSDVLVSCRLLRDSSSPQSPRGKVCKRQQPEKAGTEGTSIWWPVVSFGAGQK